MLISKLMFASVHAALPINDWIPMGYITGIGIGIGFKLGVILTLVECVY